MEEEVNLNDMEDKYKSRIQQLEKENLELLAAFDGLQNENRLLRTKYEKTSNGDVITEGYDIVNAGRIALKQREVMYKKRIKELEEEKLNTFKSLQNQYKKFEKLDVLNGISSVTHERIIVISETDSAQVLKEENKELRQKVETLEKEKRRLERKIIKLEQNIENDVQKYSIFVYDWMSYLKSIGVNSKPEKYLRLPKEPQSTYKYSSNARLKIKPDKPWKVAKPSESDTGLSKHSEPLPAISPQTWNSTSSISGSDYLSLYKRRLSWMATKKSFSSLSYSSFED